MISLPRRFISAGISQMAEETATAPPWRRSRSCGSATENDLPIDAHELIALCAPRPVFIGAGSTEKGDGWVDAKGMFLAAAAAGPVYRLLGKKDLGSGDFPPIETTLIDGDIAFRQHSGGHSPGPNWPTFLKFADRYLGSTSK